MKASKVPLPSDWAQERAPANNGRSVPCALIVRAAEVRGQHPSMEEGSKMSESFTPFQSEGSVSLEDGDGGFL